MNDLRNILIERMVGDMTQILTPKNATKPAEDLLLQVMEKIDAAEAEIRQVFKNKIEEAKTKAAPITFLCKWVDQR